MFTPRPVVADGLPSMPRISITGRSGETLWLSRLILGTDHLGQVPTPGQTLEVLDEAVRLGINAFDTAPIYDKDIERTFATWLSRKRRPDLHVITKGGFPRDLGPGTYESRLKGTRERMVEEVREELEISRAKYDRPISIYLMHRDDVDFKDYVRVDRSQTPAQLILEALASPVLRQHFRMLGLSNWTPERIIEARDAARRNPELPEPVCSSPYFSLLEMKGTTLHSGGVQVTHRDMMNPNFLPGVRMMTYSTLGGFSIVTPGWDKARQRALALKKRKDRYWSRVYDALFHDENRKRYERAISFAKRFNARHGTSYTLDQFMHAYVLAHPRTDFVVIGPKNVGALRRTVQSLELAKLLEAEDLLELYRGLRYDPPAEKHSVDRLAS